MNKRKIIFKKSESYGTVFLRWLPGGYCSIGFGREVNKKYCMWYRRHKKFKQYLYVSNRYVYKKGRVKFYMIKEKDFDADVSIMDFLNSVLNTIKKEMGVEVKLDAKTD